MKNRYYFTNKCTSGLPADFENRNDIYYSILMIVITFHLTQKNPDSCPPGFFYLKLNTPLKNHLHN